MKNLRHIILFIFFFIAIAGYGQNANTIQNYIDAYREIAMAEMQRTGVPAAIKLAQGIHETTAGTSDLVRRSNNHFGIKCKSDWTGESVKHTDDALNECFRKYNDPSQSYRDHSDFLKKSNRYASLFDLDPMDYSAWAYGLKKAGYATNPKYPQIIIKLIETWQLQDYTLIALGKMPPKEIHIGKETAEENREGAIAAALTMPPASRQSDYPSWEFKINDSRVIYVPAGTSFLAIAQQYNLPLARVFEFNELEPAETLLSGQLIYLQRKRKTGSNEFHIVKEGETLADVAREEAIRMESLMEYNHLKNTMQPATGEQLYLQKKAPAMPKLAKTELATNRISGL